LSGGFGDDYFGRARRIAPRAPTPADGLQIREQGPMNRVMEVTSNTEALQRIWDLYATGRTEEILAYLDPAVEWRPTVLDSATYRGHAGVRRWASAMRRAWKSVTLVYEEMREVADGCVVSNGRIAAFDHEGELLIDSPLACVAEFRDGLMARACAFASIDDAMAWVSARPRLPA
jgi:SnoaL-like domain